MDEKSIAPWYQVMWRPMMAWQYFIICMFDFLVAPIMYASITAGTDRFIQWTPLTLQGGGLYHLAMGAIIGVTAWSRGQEKMVWMNQFGSGERTEETMSQQPVIPDTETTNIKRSTAGIP